MGRVDDRPAGEVLGNQKKRKDGSICLRSANEKGASVTRSE